MKVIEATDAVKATATCPHVHRWDCTVRVELQEIHAAFGTHRERVRIVEPEHCPRCGERWDETSITPAELRRHS